MAIRSGSPCVAKKISVSGAYDRFVQGEGLWHPAGNRLLVGSLAFLCEVRGGPPSGWPQVSLEPGGTGPPRRRAGLAEAFASDSTFSETESAGRGFRLYFEVIWLVYFLTNSYIVIDDYSPIPSFYPMVGIYLLYFALVCPLQVSQVVAKPLFWFWSITLVVPAAMYFLGSSPILFAWPTLVLRISFFACLAGSAVLLSGPDAPRVLRTAARISLAIAVTLSFADLFFENPYNRAEVTGRTAGLYSDTNKSAAAIGTLLLLSVDISKQSFKSILVVGISVLAIISTQSRSGMIFSAILLAAYLFIPQGRGTFSLSSRLGIGIAGVFVLFLAVAVAPALIGLDTSGSWRITSLLSLDFSDPSSQGRLDVLSYAVSQFFDAFWSGHGLGSARFYDISSHNAYLELAFEYGVGGLLLWVFLLLVPIVKSMRFGLSSSITVLMITFQIFYYGFFSHGAPSFVVFAVFFAAVLTGAAYMNPDQTQTLESQGSLSLDSPPLQSYGRSVG